MKRVRYSEDKLSKYLVLSMLTVLGSTILLSFFAATCVVAQDIYSEEYMRQHDGGDRAEYLKELEHSDRLFYVPPVNDASFPASNNTSAN
jgi:hypothetical protein